MANFLLRFKDFLKTVPVVYSINGLVKAYITARKYRVVNRFYVRHRDGLKNRQVESCTLPVSDGMKVNDKSGSDKKKRILYLGTDWLQDSSGFLQDLKEFGEVFTFTRYDGSYGHYVYGKGKAIDRGRKENARRLLEMVNMLEENGGLDLILGQMWGRTMPWKTLKAIKDKGIKVVNICMDDRHSFWGRKYKKNWLGSVGLAKGLNLAVTTTPEACLWHETEGCPAIYSPLASSTKVFNVDDRSKLYDVVFVGAQYGARRNIVNAIKKAGINIVVYGEGWPEGRIDTDKVPELFARSRIVLGVGTIGYCNDFYSLKLRDFDVPFSGSFYITHDNPDLYDLYKIGKEIVTYRTAEECVKKINYYLKNTDERQNIAKAGHERAIKDHTWNNRFKKIFSTIEHI